MVPGTGVPKLNKFNKLGSIWTLEAPARAREIIADTRSYLASDMPVSAEIEIEKLIPE